MSPDAAARPATPIEETGATVPERAASTHVWLVAILALAAGLRLWAVGHDLPFVYYYDEAHLMNRAVGFGRGDLNPHWFHKPALYMYVLFAQYGAYFVMGRLAGVFGSVDAFAVQYFRDKTVFALLGRLTSGLCGIGCVAVLYVLARRRYGHRVGLAAAAFLAVTYAHVRSSHFVKADQMAALFSVLALLFIFRVAEEGRRRHYVLAGLFVGLGTATKYSPVLLVGPLWFAHVQYEWRRDVSRGQRWAGGRFWAALAVVVGAFFIGSPYNFLDSHWFTHNVLPLFGAGRGASVYAGYGEGAAHGFLARVWTWVRVVFRRDAMGFPLAVVSVHGLVFLLARRRRADVLLAVTVAWVFVAFRWRNYEPWLLNSFYPVLCLSGAVFVVRATESLAGQVRALQQRMGWVVACAVLAVAAAPAVASVQFNTELSLPDTRTVACQWFEGHVSAGSAVVLDEYGPPLSANAQSYEDELARARKVAGTTPFTHHLVDYYGYLMRAAREPSYRIWQLSHVWWAGNRRSGDLYHVEAMRDADYANPAKVRGALPLHDYIRQGYQYAVISSIRYDRYLNEDWGQRFPGVLQYYRDVMTHGTLLHEVAPAPHLRRGPTIRIYRLPIAAPTGPSPSQP